MPHNGSEAGPNARAIGASRTRYSNRVSGRLIRRQIERRFDAILRDIAREDPTKIRQTAFARWILDNSHLVRQALQQIEGDLPATYHRQLPSVAVRDVGLVARVFGLIDETVDASGLPLDCRTLEVFCRDYSSPASLRTRLTLGELWAVPIILRVILLTRLCEAAELCQAGVIEDQDESDGAVDIIAGCITSLRTVATFTWRTFVDRTSVVEKTLRRDPSRFYARMDFETRDRYRDAIEQIARGTSLEQWEIAEAALTLARQAERDGDVQHRTHIGYYVVDNGRQALHKAVGFRSSIKERLKFRLRRYRVALYLFAVLAVSVAGGGALTLALLGATASPLLAILAGGLSLIPLLSVSAGAVNFVASLAVAPRRLSKLDFSDGIPAGYRSMVVVPMLLSSPEEIAENLKTLEQNYLGNSDPHLHYALLSDFTDADAAEAPTDRTLLEQVTAGIDELNERYAKNDAIPFALFHRRRCWNRNAKCWMGWERKRGKLEELNELLRGATDTSYVLQHGADLAVTPKIEYVITLDADSYMPTGAARKLVGTLAHPLNRPQLDASGKRIVRGYTVIQPRLETNPVTSADTLFAKIFAGDVLLDLYTNAVSDVYQDVFGDAVFAGKGIYDVDAFRTTVAKRIPENAVLSHDLLEGLLGRAGLASDIVVLENYPQNYLVYLRRLHRWVRGDWQLLPWLTNTRTGAADGLELGALGRWKLFDNLRRSLVTPAILLLLLLAWTSLPGDPLAWTLLFALFPGLPILLRVTLALRTSLWRWGTIESSLRNLLGHAGADAARWILALVFLPAEAYVVTDAALRTLHRVMHSRQRMLEWSTAAQTARSIGYEYRVLVFYRSLWAGPAMAIIAGFAVTIFHPQALVAAGMFILCWFCSPLIALRLAVKQQARSSTVLAKDDALMIRGIARDTWRFFERFVGPDTNWLPPDNVQEYPQRLVAERTSPTNIGMMLLSTLTAYDLGYLGRRQLLTRLRSHLESIQRLTKHRGHLLNWYATRDLRPLEPHYVSTVDSGNFISALIILRQSLLEMPHRAYTGERAIRGLTDELAALSRQLFPDETKQADAETVALLNVLDSAKAVLADSIDPLTLVHQFEHQYCGEIEHAFLAALERNPTRWSAEEISDFRENAQVLRQRIRIILADVELYSPWSEKLLATPPILESEQMQDRFARLSSTFGSVAEADLNDLWLVSTTQMISEMRGALSVCANGEQVEQAKGWLDDLKNSLTAARSAIKTLEQSRDDLIRSMTTLIENTDFKFLYDDNRNLFRVGYNASTGESDSSYYDLLASEARIASFVAIAKGDIPAKHWIHLGRPLTRVHGVRILLSWSATAFEYLMPRLLMRSPPTGLLDQSCEGAIAEQIRFAREHDIPWGVSESGYAQFDSHGNYQYFAFGIPKLGLKWDQGERLVVSSYASVLALPYAATETVRNLRRLIALGGGGHYGLFEALDFGEAHKPRAARPRVVQSYMAHHQGMILVAIGNALLGDQTLNRFHRDPRIASVEHLLHERLPTRVETRPLERLPAPLKELPFAPAPVTQWQHERDDTELAIVSNGRLASRVSDQGGGALYWRGTAITRWNPLLDGQVGGSCVYLKDLDSGQLRRVGAEPLPRDVETFFAPHVVEFRARRNDMLMRMSIVVAPAEEVEIRRITITNDSSSAKRIMLCSYCEPVLADDGGDRRHPAFSKMFIESQLVKDEGILLFRRRQRETDQASIYLAQRAVVENSAAFEVSFEVDRGAFLGRDGSLSNPSALMSPNPQLGNELSDTLDPCAAIALSLTIPARTTVQCAFLSSVGNTRASAIGALHSFSSFDRIDWTMEAARLQSERELTVMQLDSDTVRDAFHLLAEVLWPRRVAHVLQEPSAPPRRVQDTLWRHGISGDRPIATMRIDRETDLSPAANMLRCIRYLSRKGFAIDAVFLDETKGGYHLPINDRLRELVDDYLVPGRERGGAAAFIVPVRNLAAGERASLIAAARVFFDPGVRTSTRLFSDARRYSPAMPAFVPQPSEPLSRELVSPLGAREDLLLTTNRGGLLPDLSGYSMLISPDSQTPAPWCNVIANRTFGTLVSESGSMCTWWGNSSENRLTPWSNDPVLDKTGEAIYARDEETGESWSLTPRPRPSGSAYRVTHAIGESLFEHISHGLAQRLQIFVDPELPLKVLRVRLTNKWPRDRRLTVTFAAQWLLGNAPTYGQHLLVPHREDETGALFIRNGYERHIGEECAFVAASIPAHGVCTAGSDFFGKKRSWESPIGLAAVGLSDQVAPNADPCAVYQIHVELGRDETREFHFLLGAAPDRDTAIRSIQQAAAGDWIEARYQAMRQQWATILDTWQVQTPDIAADAMINRWLLYQVIASRLWGRIGFYQASGGFGFRDQLQDVLALLDTRPQDAREQILTAASRQFEEGDVLHWWHEAPLRGVRTRCSDDLLWLPYAVAEYIDVTDDETILHAEAHFLGGELLGAHEQERYAEFQTTSSCASIYEHCCRALDSRIAFGAHGMPFIGSGDWNDGMNRVGEKGQGESVWMAWFLIIVCRRFAPLCRAMEDARRADYYEKTAEDLLQRTQESAWADSWYVRGYFDDGTPLGAPGDDESEIDLNAQTWAVLADPLHPAAAQAMRSAADKLIDDEHRLIKLLAPPFDKIGHDPGYIKAYPPGVRENGGQYTHAAVWAAWAAAELGDKDNALRWFNWLNPLNRANTDEEIQHYRLEPYVMPGDVYGSGSLTGRGGWSWYTGSAAWLYRFAIRQLLGLQRRGDRLYVRPCLPNTWPSFQACFHFHNAEHRLQVHHPSSIRHDELFIIKDGCVLDLDSIDLDQDGVHVYEIFASDSNRRQWLSEHPPLDVSTSLN